MNYNGDSSKGVKTHLKRDRNLTLEPLRGCLSGFEPLCDKRIGAAGETLLD